MASNRGEERPTLESIAAYVKANAARARKAQQMHHGDSTVTREGDYKGHHFVVRTKYEVEIDGKPLMGHMGVADDGSVHYHPVPNLSFGSALDMVRKIIDVFPDDFDHKAAPPAMPRMGHASHTPVSGMKMKRKSAVKRPAKVVRKRKN
jgi:hypothetical protein